jgi:peptidyl-prolyl cis-trans isomerase SurA
MTRRVIFSGFAALLQALACGLFFFAAADAARRPLDGVVAVVNDDVILASELGEEVSVRLYQMEAARSAVRDLRAFTAEVLADMIDDYLLLQDADERDIVVSKDDVQPYLDEELARIRGAFSSQEEYEATLAQYGMTEKDLIVRYRKTLRDQLKIRRLLDEVLAPRVEVSEEEMRAYYDAHRDDLALPAIFKLREIAIAKLPSAETRARIKGRLQAIKDAAGAGGDFAARAKKVADEEGGEFGRSFKFMPGEAVPALERAAAGLRPGEISPVSAGPDGYWLVRLVSVENERREVQYVHLKVAVTDADVAAARARAEEAVAALARGESFADVAAEYSENEETAAEGGLVGEVALDEIAADMPEVAEAVKALSPGDVTGVIERPEGFFILKVDERREGREVPYEEARDVVKRTLRAQKLSVERKKYVQELKDKAYIKTFE